MFHLFSVTKCVSRDQEMKEGLYLHLLWQQKKKNHFYFLIYNITKNELLMITIWTRKLILSQKVQSDDIVVQPHVVRSLMKDAQTWTHDPEFDCSLFIRIFCPEGFRKSGLKCSLSYSGNMFKTPILDDSDNEVSDDTTFFLLAFYG